MSHNLLSKLGLLISLPYLSFKSKLNWLRAGNNLPGKEYYAFGREIGLKLLGKLKVSPKLFLNPVSIVRYFEFEFVKSVFNVKSDMKVLDIASPYLFSFKLMHEHKIDIRYINPDPSDIQDVMSKYERLNLKGNLQCLKMNALDLNNSNTKFDVIYSISVIEHVSNDQDSDFILAAWNSLKAEGLLILTFPVKKAFEEEYIDKDIYGLNKNNESDKYFFQRFYDNKSIRERLLDQLSNFEIVSQKIFGDKSGEFYEDYHARWKKIGYLETIKDPIHITSHFTHFNSISELPGMGVMGIAIKKLK